jgi:hypothetical protein
MIGAKYNENEHVKRFTAVGLRTCFRNFQFTQESPGGYKDKADIAAFCSARLRFAAIVRNRI